MRIKTRVRINILNLRIRNGCLQGLKEDHEGTSLLEEVKVKTESSTNLKTENDSEDQEMLEVRNLTQRQTCFLLFTKFSKEVS